LDSQTLNKEAERSYETSINNDKLTRPNIRTDLNSQNLHYISHFVLQCKPIVCDAEVKNKIEFLPGGLTNENTETYIKHKYHAGCLFSAVAL